MDKMAATYRRIRLLPEAADKRIAPASWQPKATELPRHRKRKVSGAKQAAAQYQSSQQTVGLSQLGVQQLRGA